MQANREIVRVEFSTSLIVYAEPDTKNKKNAQNLKS